MESRSVLHVLTVAKKFYVHVYVVGVHRAYVCSGMCMFLYTYNFKQGNWYDLPLEPAYYGNSVMRISQMVVN